MPLLLNHYTALPKYFLISWVYVKKPNFTYNYIEKNSCHQLALIALFFPLYHVQQ